MAKKKKVEEPEPELIPDAAPKLEHLKKLLEKLESNHKITNVGAFPICIVYHRMK